MLFFKTTKKVYIGDQSVIMMIKLRIIQLLIYGYVGLVVGRKFDLNKHFAYLQHFCLTIYNKWRV